MAEALFTNVQKMFFGKPFIAFKRGNGSGYDAGMAVAKSISVEDILDLVEQMGPESDLPVGVGIGSRSLPISGEHGIFDIELLSTFRGGQSTFQPGGNKTIFQAYGSDRPLPWDMRVRSTVSGNEIEGFFYRGVMTNYPVVVVNDHQFVASSFSGRLYGRDIDTGQNLLYEISAPGNATTSS